MNVLVWSQCINLIKSKRIKLTTIECIVKAALCTAAKWRYDRLFGEEQARCSEIALYLHTTAAALKVEQQEQQLQIPNTMPE